VKNWVLKTEVNGSTSDGKIASLPLMTRSLILGQQDPRSTRALNRFPAVMEKYLALRNYTLLHNELRNVWENDP